MISFDLFGDDFETKSATDSVSPPNLFTTRLYLARPGILTIKKTDLYFFLVHIHFFDNYRARGLVWFGILGIFCFEHGLIFRTTRT